MTWILYENKKGTVRYALPADKYAIRTRSYEGEIQWALEPVRRDLSVLFDVKNVRLEINFYDVMTWLGGPLPSPDQNINEALGTSGFRVVNRE